MRIRSWTVLVLAVAVVGCSAAPSGAHPSTAPAVSSSAASAPPQAGTDWPTYHLNAARTGVAAGLPAAGRLSIHWHATLDGAVYGQPLVIGDQVVAATEDDSVYGLSLATGRVEWRVQLGTPVPLSSLPCGDINPLGITSTPVYDPATGLVYVVAETTGFAHILAGIEVSDGMVRFRRDIATPDGQPRDDQQRAALTIDEGRVYVSFGGLAGDCDQYRGSINGIPVSGHGPMVSYVVPTPREGAMWEPGGPVVAADGTIYTAVGNGAATSGRFDGSDSVNALTPSLHRTGIFAPRTWAVDNANDLDLGSVTPAVLPGGEILQVGKRGTGYLLSAAHLTGVGSQLYQAPVCPAYGGTSVDGDVVYVPCEGGGGMAAVEVTGERFHVLWRGPSGGDGSPVLGGGAVWVDDWDAGVLYELNPATGAVQHHIALGSALPHFASPSLTGPLVLVGTLNGVVAVDGA